MPDADVLISYRPTSLERAEALDWVLDRYDLEHPAWHVHLGTHDGGVWSKGTAVRNAAMEGTAGVVVVADADVWIQPEALTTAVQHVQAGRAGWAVPHTLVHRLTAESTRLLLHRDRVDPGLLGTCERPYRGVMGGGIVVLRRELLERVPVDPRFEGWGEEDMSWGIALATIAGRPWRGAATLIHLWHRPQDRTSRKRGSVASQRLRRRYMLARRDPAVMRELLEEVTECPSSIC